MLLFFFVDLFCLLMEWNGMCCWVVLLIFVLVFLVCCVFCCCFINIVLLPLLLCSFDFYFVDYF